jgi:hypothetical protein
MEENISVPSSINFNCWKHHSGFIKQQIKLYSRTSEQIQLKKHLLIIGESKMDLYFGKLSPSEISRQIISYLKKEKSFSFDRYTDLLSKDGKNYKLIQLSDKSSWTLRLGENQERYVHIHPARYSPHTIRVKATTLKTVILILCFEQAKEIGSFNTEIVNNIRKKYLKEPPLKSISKASGLIRIIDLLCKNYK